MTGGPELSELSTRTFRVYGIARDIPPILQGLYSRQIGKWICAIEGWLPDVWPVERVVLCVVDDFGDLVVVR